MLHEANDIINANASDLSSLDDDFEDSGTDLDDEIVIGDWVESSGLTSKRGKWMNGTVGEVTEADAGSERVGVKVDSEDFPVAMRRSNLRVVGYNA